MKIAGEATLLAPVDQVWAALLDPQVLVRTIPGCERLELVGENAYAMTVTAGVAAVRGTYDGSCRLSDLQQHESLRMRLEGAGAPGTIAADVDVRFDGNADGTTTLNYSADAVVGGMVGGVGQRMLTSVSRRMATEFFGNVERAIGQVPAGVTTAGAPAEAPAGAPAAAAAPGTVFTAPPRAAVGSETDFFKGVVLGAGLVLLGVVVGSRLGRRR